MKRMIVLISGPYQFLQALWYCTEHPEYEYVALLKLDQQNEASANRTRELCQTCGIFSQVMEYGLVKMDSSFVQLAKLGIKMFLHYITGRRKVLAAKIIREQIGTMEYDAVLLDSDFSILAGCFIACSDTKKVVIMQEGSSDLLPRRDFPRMNPRHLLGFIFARMGFANFAINYKLPDIHNCDKLMSRPELAVYRDYKQIQTLFQPGEHQQLFLQRLSELYTTVDWNLVNDVDYVLFTSPIDLFYNEPTVCEQMRQWLRSFAMGKKILIKKHPRDAYAYDWDEFEISFIDESVPAEIFLSQINKPHIIYMYLSTIMMNMPAEQTDYTLLYFNSVKAPMYRDGFYAPLKALQIDESKIQYL